jgi:hypothetical protein
VSGLAGAGLAGLVSGLAGVWSGWCLVLVVSQMPAVWLVSGLVDVWCWSGWCLVLVVSQMPAVWLVLVWLVWCLVWLVSGAGGVPDASRLAGAGLAGVWCWSGWCFLLRVEIWLKVAILLFRR